MQNSKNVENHLKSESCQDWINTIYVTTFPTFSMGELGWKSGFMFCCEGIELVAILTFPRRVLVCSQSVQPPG